MVKIGDQVLKPRPSYSGSIFKYLDIDGATKTLENGTLLFGSPLFFNDPFDISIQTLFNYDPLDLETFLDEFVELIFSDEPVPQSSESVYAQVISKIRSRLNGAGYEYKASLRKELSVSDIWDEKALYSVYQDFTRKIQAAFSTEGVFCGSKTNNNYLLWAHYADKHQGAVLEFIPNIEKDSVLLLADEVTYSSDRPHMYHSHKDYIVKTCFHSTEEVLADYTRKITKTKSKEWEYEEEIRVCVPFLINIPEGKKNHCLTYHDDELRSVYLGCRMLEQDRKEISNLAKIRNRNVQIFEMTPDPFHYQLKPKPF